MTPAPPLFPFDNSYVRLPERFYQRVDPTPVAAPALVKVNAGLAAGLGIDPGRLASPEGVAVLAGNLVPENAATLAMAYAGHQFGGFVPQLGDGRAILLGEVRDLSGARRDVHLKGAGRTRFSRRGDGRAALGPVLREYIVSEAMAALGIPTTRTLAAVTTGETVLRETPLPGAVLARVAASHIRVGTFEYFAARGDTEGLRLLADYAIARHGLVSGGAANPYRDFLEAVVARQADLVAAWLLAGFIHGVMNTDNTAVSGETIDYGPCAFMDSYDPDTVYSSIDTMGRYAYRSQPAAAHWNLARLAETLLPLLAPGEARAAEDAQAALATFAPRFEAAYHGGLARKIGLRAARPGDAALAEDLLARMAENGADFTLTFRRLADVAADPAGATGLRALFKDPGACDAWLDRWRARFVDEADAPGRAAMMRSVNPAFIPRNHLVAEAIAAAVDAGDFKPFARLLEVLARPFDDQPDAAGHALPPRPEQVVRQTFCGT